MEEERTNFDVPTLSVGGVVEQLTGLYTAAVINGFDFKAVPPVMLWGPPGIGKSQTVRQLANRLQDNTSKTVNITDVRLLLYNPIDLRGIPTSNEDKTLAVWLKPKVFQMDGSRDVINLLFLDEITAAPQSVQAAAYQITLDRVVGEHRLPDNCLVIAAGNRVTDRSVAYKMPKALANRLLHMEVDVDFASWRKWAVEKGIDERVTGFLSFRQERLMTFDPSNDDRAYATPRSWEMVSNILNSREGRIKDLRPLIAGLIGTGTAEEFVAWEEVFQELPNISDIFHGRKCKVPVRPDALYAVTSAMVSYARENRNDMPLIANSIRYAEKLPPDFTLLVIKDYMHLEKGYKEKLMALPEVRRWLSTKGELLNGIV